MEVIVALFAIAAIIGLVVLLSYSLMYVFVAAIMSAVMTFFIAVIAHMMGHEMADDTMGTIWIILTMIFIILGFFSWFTGLFGINNNENYNANENHNISDNSNNNNIVINNVMPQQPMQQHFTPRHGEYPYIEDVEVIPNNHMEKIEHHETKVLNEPIKHINRNATFLKGMYGLPDISISQNNNIIVGRSNASSVRIQNEHVSARHVKLQVSQDGRVQVIDLGSTNGSYINGKKLDVNRVYTLQKGDKLILGSEDVVYTL